MPKNKAANLVCNRLFRVGPGKDMDRISRQGPYCFKRLFVYIIYLIRRNLCTSFRLRSPERTPLLVTTSISQQDSVLLGRTGQERHRPTAHGGGRSRGGFTVLPHGCSSLSLRLSSLRPEPVTQGRLFHDSVRRRISLTIKQVLSDIVGQRRTNGRIFHG